MDSRIYTSKMIQSLKNHFADSTSKFVPYPKFIFLCGKSFKKEEYEFSNRGTIESFIKSRANNFAVVLSERLWEYSFSSKIDLLTFEEFLAEVSDYIILFPESPGSFCELGAFAYDNVSFGEKLIIVNDNKYKSEDSFVATGPIAKAERNGAVILYANLSGNGLLSSKELRDKIIQIIDDSTDVLCKRNYKAINKIEQKVNISAFISELLELIRLLQPIKSRDLIDIYKEIKGFTSFSFVKRNKQEFKISLDYIYKLLIISDIIYRDENDNIYLKKPNEVSNLMFRYYGMAADKERSKTLCRKFRFGEKV